MDADLRERYDAHQRRWWEDYLAEEERRAGRKAWRRRHPWLLYSGIGVAIAAYIGLIVAIALGINISWWGSCRTVTVHVDQPLVKGQ